MALSTYEIVYFCVEIFLYCFHLSLLILLFIRKKTAFHGTFYAIFRVVLFADLATFIMNNINGKLSLISSFIPFYATNEYIAPIVLNISTFFAVLQFIGHSMMSFNRFSLVFFPLQQQAFWRRSWYIFLLWFLPFVRISWRLHEPAKYVYSADFSSVSARFTSAEVTLISVVSSLVIYISTTFLAAIFNLLAIGKLYFQKKTTVNVNEKSLLFVSTITFFAQLLRTAYTATQYFFPINGNLATFFSFIYPYIVDIFALSGSISLIVLWSVCVFIFLIAGGSKNFPVFFITFLETISNKLYCCEAETVYAEGKNISAFDFKFLLSKNAKSFVLKNFVFYYNYKLPYNTNESIYEIAERFPNIEKLEYTSACITCLAPSPNWKRCHLSGSLICFMCGLKMRRIENFNKKRSFKYPWKSVFPRKHQKSPKHL